MSTRDLLNVADYEAAAREILPQMVFDYYAGGSWDEITLRENTRAFDRLRLRYRVLRDVARRSTATTVLGHDVASPILVAPTAFQQMAHPDGEVATARAAAAAGTVMIVSTLSNRPLEEIAAAAGGSFWFQLYVYNDRAATADLLARAVEAGASAIVLTVDAQVWGIRERDVRNRFQLPAGLEMSNLLADMSTLPAEAEDSGLGAYVASMFDQSLSWKDLEWLRGLTDLPLVLKGIVHPDDARLAVEHGAAGVFVSNHGGRQVDTAPATLDVLEEIVAAIDGEAEVLLDGGIRRGSDAVKALALGARAVAVGRPALWGLAVDGGDGVERLLELLRHEFESVMALCGATSPAELTRELIG